MTLEQYTSLRAELSVSPEPEAVLLKKYQVYSPDARAALDDLWQQHFARNPSMRDLYEELLAKFTLLALELHAQAEPPQR